MKPINAMYLLIWYTGKNTALLGFLPSLNLITDKQTSPTWEIRQNNRSALCKSSRPLMKREGERRERKEKENKKKMKVWQCLYRGGLGNMTTDVLLAQKRDNWQDMNKICKLDSDTESMLISRFYQNMSRCTSGYVSKMSLVLVNTQWSI